MEIKFDLDFYDLQKFCWGGAISTLNGIEAESKGGDLMSLLEDISQGETPTITQINDLLWFDRTFIYEHLGILDDVDDTDSED